MADDGDKGLQLARQHRPKVITLDVLMPEMDGWSVLTALKADPELATIPVIMLTIMDDKNIGFTLGAVEYMSKPIDKVRLATILKRYRSGQVLVVEDSPVVRLQLRQMLAHEGWLVNEAENGRIALQKIEQSEPDLILLDLMMPEMDGFEFVLALRQKRKYIPIIVLTAQDLTATDRERLNGYTEAILQKGRHSREDLLHQIRYWLESGAVENKEHST